jgi:cell division inhibitor SepF
MGFMHRVKVMLGLADEYDDEYDDEYAPEEEYREDEDGDEDFEPAPRYTSPYSAKSQSVRRVSREPDLARARDATPLRAVPAPVSEPAGGTAQVKIHAVEPRGYSEAQSIADKFKAGQPVIMNLTSTDAELSKRLLDFASGLTYGLDGGIQKVSDRVFMLTPRNVDVSAAGERTRSRSAGLFGE